MVTSGMRSLNRSTVPGIFAGENASGPICIEGISVRSASTTALGSFTSNCPGPTPMIPNLFKR